MEVLSFLHQKGGTGKSTLAIASALWLAGAGRRVLLLDTDYQGTSSEWGNRFAERFGVETRSQVQPIVHRELERFGGSAEWVIIDGPPALSEMSQSVVRCGGRVILPVRPALPDVWARAWIAAIIGKLAREGPAAAPLVAFNQVRDEPLAPLLKQIAALGLSVHPRSIPADPGFVALFAGEPLPEHLRDIIGELVQGATSP